MLHLDSGRYERGANVLLKWGMLFWMEGRISWLGDIFKAKMSYWEKLWNVLQKFLKTGDSLIHLGWQTYHLLWAQEWAHCTHQMGALCPPPHNWPGCPIGELLPPLFLHSHWSPRCPLIWTSSAAPCLILMLFSLRPTYLELPYFCPLVVTHEPAATTHVPFYRI